MFANSLDPIIGKSDWGREQDGLADGFGFRLNFRGREGNPIKRI